MYTEWGCTILEGSFDTLLKYPKRKAVKYNNWAEADGIDPDLSVVEFEQKTVKLSFLMEADTVEQFWLRYRKFITDLSAPLYREFDLIPGITTRYRFSAGSSYEQPVLLTSGGISPDLSYLLWKTTMPYIRLRHPVVSICAGNMQSMG